jgi:hypothetical protein
MAQAYSNGASTVSYLIVFTLGYLLGGFTALIVLGLTVAARRGDRGNAAPKSVARAEESAPVWTERS